MNRHLLGSTAAALAVVVTSALPATLPAATAVPDAAPTSGSTATAPLPLGPADLPETRTSRTLEPGVTYTRIDRGAVDPSVRWVVELSIPATQTSPDPDAPPRSVEDEGSADALVTRLAAAGFDAAAQPVHQWQAADVDAGTIGYRVRLTTTYAGKADADAEVATLVAAGFKARSWYTGWDGGTDLPGHWSVNVLTIDPRTFRGSIGSTFGPDLFQRERTTELAAYAHAGAAVNGGFFVLDPAAGAPGDPAGAAVEDGHLVSETVGDRPVLVLDRHAQHTEVTRPVWTGTAQLPSGRAALDGLDRVPGLIRNCGGLGDSPVTTPLHDVTCTDPGELVAFDTRYAATTPSGAGREVVLDASGRVVRIADTRGTALAAGQHSIQATGDRVGELDGLEVGSTVPLRLTLQTADGDDLAAPGTSVVNGGPQLLQGGAPHITQAADGMVHPGDPSFQYGWVLQRNPRTFAGVDAQGRTLLVTVDGRQPGEMGLSIEETAAVAQALGMRDAINLDGGGSTAMAVGGALVNHPSDAAGERPVGDAIVVR